MNKKFVTLFLVVIILIFASAENVAREKILTDCIEMVINGVKNGYVRDNDNLIYVLERMCDDFAIEVGKLNEVKF